MLPPCPSPFFARSFRGLPWRQGIEGDSQYTLRQVSNDKSTSTIIIIPYALHRSSLMVQVTDLGTLRLLVLEILDLLNVVNSSEFWSS